MRGVLVHILRDDLGDCTAGGITSPTRSRGKTFVLFDRVFKEGNFDLEACQADDAFVCLRVERRWVGTPREYLHVEEMDVVAGEGQVGPMFGGNYVRVPRTLSPPRARSFRDSRTVSGAFAMRVRVVKLPLLSEQLERLNARETDVYAAERFGGQSKHAGWEPRLGCLPGIFGARTEPLP